MIPPVPRETLDANPKFAALVQQLSETVLDPFDASTRSTSSPNDALDQELRTHRAELAKTQILRQELEALTSRATGLSEELQETVDLLTSPFYRNLSDTDKLLLQDEFDELEDSLPIIGQHMSTSLQKSSLEIAQVAFPNEDPRKLEQRIEFLPAEIAHRLNTLQTRRASLIQKQMAVAQTCLEILDLYTTLTTHLRDLHTLKTTTLAAALSTKSTHLSLVASNMHLKLSILKHTALSAIYDPETVNALENYRMHLTDTSTRLVARQRVVEGELKKYKSAGSDMKAIVEKYGQVLRLVEAVGRDIKRLEAGR
ncbi:hypothetical protein EX30DRAFT_339023 [Ascodesmis nigricans]|uniref:Uncharacterized protein n=1 Tax=Ascodesmis nigricans TaxID=341454 RepID=A0A4V6RHG6_9PEZI|nr:hypothetical protein EX30DRAFT_339023 [Ascodesmis nigricans]